MHPRGEVGRTQVDNRSSPPGDLCRYLPQMTLPEDTDRPMSETWKAIAGYEGYFSVSDLGRIRSETRTVPHKRHGSVTYTGKMLSPTITERGANRYCLINLTKDGKGKSWLVHRLVAAAFVDNPNDQNVVNHIDGDGTNNRASNLEWISAQENTEHAYRLGLAKGNVGIKNPSAKLTVDDVRAIKELIREGQMTQRAIAEKFGVVPMVITDIKKGRTWTHVE